MSAGNKLQKSETSFWYDHKKQIVILTVLSLAVIGLGAYFFMHSRSVEAEKAAELLASIKPPCAPESWVQKYFGTTNINDPKVGGCDGDPDHDGLTNRQEYIYGTDPTNPDTDGDGVKDGVEIAYGSDPLNTGMSTTTAMVTQTLRQAGVDISQQEISQQFAQYENSNRQPDIATASAQGFQTVPATPENLKAYSDGMKAALAFDSDPTTIQQTQNFFANVSASDVDDFIAKQADSIHQLLVLPVPEGLQDLHLGYVQMLEATQSIAEYARTQLSAGNAPDPLTFYPEIRFMAQLNAKLLPEKNAAVAKYQISL